MPMSTETPPSALAHRSRIGSLIAQGTFITLVEIVPPRGIDCSEEIEGARLLAQWGVHAINVPDSPRASARMSAQSLCIQIQQHTGIETILHYTCRDRNMLSIQSDLLGASSIGLRNILCLTGDPPKLGNYPDATAVFDVDSIGLVNMVQRPQSRTGYRLQLHRRQHQLHDRRGGEPWRARYGAGAAALSVQGGGGRGVLPSPSRFSILRLLEDFLKRVEAFRIPVIAGIWPLTSLRNAEFMKNDLRVSMPEEIMLRMAQADTPEAAREGGDPDRAGDAEDGSTDGRRSAGGRAIRPVQRRGRSHRLMCCRMQTRVPRSKCMASFEESLKKLEGIVEQLEKGDLALEESLKLFEEGVGLSAACKKELDEAEGRVQTLVKQRDGSLKEEPLLTERPS